MSALFAIQVVVTAISCAFYRCTPGFSARIIYLFILAVPLLDGQGCIAGPRHTWVGIYWIAPTLLYAVSVSIVHPSCHDILMLLLLLFLFRSVRSRSYAFCGLASVTAA